MPRLNTVEETADKLRVCRETVYKLIRIGELPSVAIGRRRLISDDAIAGFIDTHTESAGAA